VGTEGVQDKEAALLGGTPRAVAPHRLEPIHGEVLIHPAFLLDTDHKAWREGILGHCLSLEDAIGRELGTVSHTGKHDSEVGFLVAGGTDGDSGGTLEVQCCVGGDGQR